MYIKTNAKVMSHRHRLVILRRVWFMLGILYYYRAVTMFITVLPKPDESYTCAQKIEDVTLFDITRSEIFFGSVDRRKAIQ